jgi:hypothetical protein
MKSSERKYLQTTHQYQYLNKQRILRTQKDNYKVGKRHVKEFHPDIVGR